MEMVMTNGFAELSANEMEAIEGGEFILTMGTLIALGGCVAAGYATASWYKHTAVPKLESFGGWVYDKLH
jgi:bacteriocin-like protein